MSEAATLTTPKTFEQKLMDRIRESIGDLMADEDLKKIVDRGVEAALFTPKKTTDVYGRVTSEAPSFVEGMVKELLSERMRLAVDAWMKENSDKLTGALDAAVKQGIGQCMLDALSSKMNGALIDLQVEIQRRLSGN